MPISKMRAVVMEGSGGPEVLSVKEVPRPVPTGKEILVRVHGSALNRADLLQRQGRYPPPAGVPVNIPGLEYAGEVAECGPRSTRFREGDRIFGIVGGGAHAEYLVADERSCALMPAGIEWMDAAAIPEVFITAHDALVTQAGLKRRERVIVTAIGSGVGLAAAQLCAARDCEVFGITRSRDKLERSRAYGVSGGIMLSEPDGTLGPAARDWSGGDGVNVALDLVGGAWTDALLGTLSLKGRLMLVGTLAGSQASITLGTILRQRLTIRGTVLRSRTLAEKAAATRAFARDVVPLIEQGTVRAVIDSVFPLEEVANAHRRMEGNESFGKVVLRVAD